MTGFLQNHLFDCSHQVRCEQSFLLDDLKRNQWVRYYSLTHYQGIEPCQLEPCSYSQRSSLFVLALSLANKSPQLLRRPRCANSPWFCSRASRPGGPQWELRCKGNSQLRPSFMASSFLAMPWSPV